MPENTISTAELLALEPQQVAGEGTSTEETGAASSETISTAELLSLNLVTDDPSVTDGPSTVDDPSSQTETRETSWWRGEEGLIPDEFQGIQRPDVEVETPTTQDVSGRFYGFGGKVPTKETEEKRKTSEGYLADEKDFKQHLYKFFDDGSLFNHIYSDEEINKGRTLREIENEAIEAGRDPSEYLLDLVKKEVGVGGVFTSRNEVDPGRKNYLNPSSMSKEENNLLFSNLNDNDIEKIIDEVFYSRLETENVNKINKDSKEELQLLKGDEDARHTHDNIRRKHIKAYRGVELSIAQLWEKIKHGDYSEEEKFGKLNEKTGQREGGFYQDMIDLKEKIGSTMLYDGKTGDLTIARNQEDANNMKSNNSDLIDLDLDQEITEYSDFLDRIEPKNRLGELQNEFEREALYGSSLNRLYDTPQVFSIRKTGYEIAAENDKKNRSGLDYEINPRKQVTTTLES